MVTRLHDLPRALALGLRLRCPRCGVGPLFRGPFRMLHNCGACHLRFEREPGYFIGAIYLNYAATVGIAVAGFFLLERYARLTLSPQLALWGTFCILFPLWIYRYTKALWLALDHFIDPETDGGG
jgi:uncharacterized protein (DUF983 family)